MTAKERDRIAEIMFESLSKSNVTRILLVELLLFFVDVPALYMRPQSVLSMYSYGATTGIIGLLPFFL